MQKLPTHISKESENTATEIQCSVNELILSGPAWQSGLFLAPVLNRLANDEEQRWLTLILSDESSSQTINWLKYEGNSKCKSLTRKTMVNH